MRSTIWLAAAAVLALPAEANIISTPVQGFNLNFEFNGGGPPQVSQTVNLSPFDTGLGTLDRVIVNFSFGQASQVGVTGVNQSPMSYARYEAKFTSQYGYRFQDPGLFFDAYYEANTYAEASCEPAYPFDCTATGEGGFGILDSREVSPNNLPVFAGSNDIAVDFFNGGAIEFFIDSVAGGIGSAQAASQLSGEIWLDYDFTPIPTAVGEPPLPILGALVLLGLLGRHRRRPKFSGAQLEHPEQRAQR